MRGILAVLICVPVLAAADYRVGVAAIDITPREPVWLAGYGNRNHPSEGVNLDLKAKAMVIQDAKGQRVAIVTTDLVGLPRAIADPVAARIEKSYGLPHSVLVLNSSHTHTGPLPLDNRIMFDLNGRDREAVESYARSLADNLVAVVGAAIQQLAPADVWLGSGRAHFAINRREPTPAGVKIGMNPEGPTDPSVPLLKVTTPDGRLRAVLFGYACHNTTMTGQIYQISGDYAGFAQEEIERKYPSATAMFLELCGADQNPNPRGTVELARQHGQELAAEVERAMEGKLERARGPIHAAYQVVDLAFAHHTRETYEARLGEKNPVRVRHARAMLRSYDEGRPIRQYPYPVQAIAFGKSLVLVALGGEVVVDYDLRIKKEYGARGVIVAGYSNDVMAYIPSLRVLKEGGYEADDSMIYYGQPGPWADDVEERIFGAIHRVMQRVGWKPAMVAGGSPGE